jgi:hypothetical protein
VRALALAWLLGCSPSIVPEHPAVIPRLSEVPTDRRDEVLASSLARPTAEQRPKTKRGRRIETLAAAAAAYLGNAFSKTENVTFGAEWIDVKPQRKPKTSTDGGDAGDAATTEEHEQPPSEPVDTGALVPWVRLK